MSKSMFTALALLGACGITSSAVAQSTGSWALTWSDEFEGAQLDASKWTPWNAPSPFNAELQYYSPDQAAVANGQLTITSLRRSIGGRQFSSARLETVGKFAQKYGRFEYRAKLPGTQGLWPAFWLLPATGQWPPEIDIMELLGHQPNKIYGTHHWGVFPANQMLGGSFVGPNFTQGFNEFAVEWWPDRIDWFVNGTLYFTSTTNIPQEPMYIIINTAVGGLWPGNPNATSVFPQFHTVDWVRVYEWQPANLLNNPAFETPGSGSDFAGWSDFGNAFTTSLQPRSGLLSAKAFGNFNGQPQNASGFSQDVPVSVGSAITASVWALNRSADAMAPGNQGLLNVEWYDASNTRIRVDSTVAMNSTFPRDIYRQAQINAVAPAGTVRARVVLLHLQATSGAGAVQFDDASLIVTDACAANCDGSTSTPRLTPADFSCFLSNYRAGDPYANCDGTTTSPTLTPADFSCFLGRYRAGCN